MIFSKSEFDLGIQFWALTQIWSASARRVRFTCLFRQKGNGDLVPVCFQQGLTLGLEGRSRSRHGVSEGQPPGPLSFQKALEPPLCSSSLPTQSQDSSLHFLSSMSGTSSPNAPLNLTSAEVVGVLRSPPEAGSSCPQTPERRARVLALPCLPPTCTPPSSAFESVVSTSAAHSLLVQVTQPLPLHPESHRHWLFCFSALTPCG